MGEAADQLDGEVADVVVLLEQAQACRQHGGVDGAAAVGFAAVTGQRVEGGATDPGTWVPQAGEQLADGLGDQQAVEQLAAALAHGGVGVLEARPDNGHGSRLRLNSSR